MEHTIEIRTNQETKVIHAKNILVASGSIPRELNVLTRHSDYVITIIGAGAVGVEFAYIYNAFGSKVTLVEMMDRILPGEDLDISRALEQKLISLGINLIIGKRIEQVYTDRDQITMVLQGISKVSCHKIMTAIGRHPNMEGL